MIFIILRNLEHIFAAWMRASGLLDFAPETPKCTTWTFAIYRNRLHGRRRTQHLARNEDLVTIALQ